MGNTIIKVENLSKAYQLGKFGTGTVTRDIQRFFTTKIRGKEDPFLKLGETNDRTKKGESDMVWSLKDINFEIQQGDSVGIVGRNGAGKSTLLKLLSRVTSPTTGSIKIKGRIASLLEVGTGFHPDLSGRENVFLNGAILGMRKKEIERKFDEIIDFSGVERYIDTPVKRYSSGMYVRLAFAVAAHLESEILIIDEVLAVGDAEFQRKCLGKIGDVSKGEGRTVLFVSHNMASVKSLCQRGILLENGVVKHLGDTASTVALYLQGDSLCENIRIFKDEYNNQYFHLHEISLKSRVDESKEFLDELDEIDLHIKIEIKDVSESKKITLVLNDNEGKTIFTFSHLNFVNKLELSLGENHLRCSFPKGFLNVGAYYLSFYFINNSKQTLFVEKDIMVFDIQQGKRELGRWMGNEPGYIKPIFNWTKE